MWTLGSVLFLVLVGSSVSRTSGLNISAEPGQNIVLPCGDPNINQVLVLEWIRSDLQEDEFVFSYRDEKVEHEGQHESFKDRVFLKNCQMKDGDLSVVLTNVKIKDSGIYECRVRQRNDSLRETKLISTINLQVSPPDQISAGSGDDVILSCRDPNINQVSVLKWTRTDLQEDGGYVTFRMNNSAGSEGRPESFKNRVFLKNNQMKDGDLSVVLKNLKIEDSGRYKCRVLQRDDPQRELTLMSTISLVVSPPPGLRIISAKPGENVILRCGDPNINPDSVVEWTRTDLKEDEYVFFRMNASAISEGRPESFKNRVFLKDNQMKDGDLSVVLENVTMEDSGRYQCRVRQRRSKRSADQPPPIAIINLQVSPPGHSHQGHLGLIAASVLVVLVLLPVVLWISKKKRSSIQSSIKQQNPEDEDCI